MNKDVASYLIKHSIGKSNVRYMYMKSFLTHPCP